jgi:hypothetical protein
MREMGDAGSLVHDALAIVNISSSIGLPEYTIRTSAMPLRLESPGILKPCGLLWEH